MARNFADKFDLILRHWRDRTGTVLLDNELQDQLERWTSVRTQLLEHPDESDAWFLQWIMKQFDCKSRTAWQCLQDTRKFFAATDTVNREFEKTMQIAALKKDIGKFTQQGDNKALMAARKLLADLTGTNRPDPNEGGGGHNTIINLFAYDPTLIGAKSMPIEQLNQLIEDILEEDTRKLEEGLRS